MQRTPWIDLSHYGIHLFRKQEGAGYVTLLTGFGAGEFDNALRSMGGAWDVGAEAYRFDAIPGPALWCRHFPKAAFVNLPVSDVVRMHDEPHPEPARKLDEIDAARVRSAIGEVLKRSPQTKWTPALLARAAGIANDFDPAIVRAEYGAPMRRIQEAFEAAQNDYCRGVVAREGVSEVAYRVAVELYGNQPPLVVRTGTSVELQQYSTPAPLSVAVQHMVDIQTGEKGFEPCIGNASLVSGFAPENVRGIELDPARFEQASAIFPQVRSGDALQHDMPRRWADVMLCNPPFGGLAHTYQADHTGQGMDAPAHIRLTRIDRAIALRALEAIKDDGRGVMILGADSYIDPPGDVSAKFGQFLAFVADHYRIADIVALDGKMYERNGASFPVRIVTVAGRGATGKDWMPPKSIPVISDWDALWEHAQRVRSRVRGMIGREAPASVVVEEEQAPVVHEDEGWVDYGMPGSRLPAIGTVVPQNLAGPIMRAMAVLQTRVGGIDEYVAGNLGWTVEEMRRNGYLKREQVDAVALAMHNMDQGGGFINGDQTGVGKGRTAAAIIRYAILKGQRPIFITEKANLFSDMMRDLRDIGSEDLVQPLIVNDGASIVDGDGVPVMRSTPRDELDRVFGTDDFSGYNAIWLTYSQINRPAEKSAKTAALLRAACGAPLVLDEAHVAGGQSNTGRNVQDMVSVSGGVFYLSGTFAKAPENMAVYSATDMFKLEGGDPEKTVELLQSGGTPLQETLSSMLTDAGQYIRREHPLRVDIAFEVDKENSERDRRIADHISAIYRGMAVVSGEVTEVAEEMSKRAKKEMARIETERGPNGEAVFSAGDGRIGVDAPNFTSRMWVLNATLLLALKADSVANRAIRIIESGKKPVLPLVNTMETALNDLAGNGWDESAGRSLVGVAVDIKFKDLLARRLENLMVLRDVSRYGDVRFKPLFDIAQMDMLYARLQEKGVSGEEKQQIRKLIHPVYYPFRETRDLIRQFDFDLPVSPIDWIKHRISKAGYACGEITGRSLYVDYDTGTFAQRSGSEVKDRTNVIHRFNNGEIPGQNKPALNAIVINEAGSTGISLHASETFRDQRPRVMCVVQPHGNVDRFVQTLGRVGRTGSVHPPEYMVFVSDLPIEIRPAAMLANKMRNLSANCKSDGESGVSLNAPNVLNWIGSAAAYQVLSKNPAMASGLYMPVFGMDEKRVLESEEFVRRMTGRIALLPVNERSPFLPPGSQLPTQDSAYAMLFETYQYVLDAHVAAHGDPFVTQLADIRGVVTEERTLMEASGDSAFEGPVKLLTVEQTIRYDPLSLEKLKAAMNMSIKSGGQKAFESALERRIELLELDQLESASRDKNFKKIARESGKYAALKAALLAPRGSDDQPVNQAQAIQDEILKTQKLLSGMKIGGYYSGVACRGEKIDAVLAYVNAPDRPPLSRTSELRLKGWRFGFADPRPEGGFFELPFGAVSGGDLAAKAAALIARDFADDRPQGEEKLRRAVLSENLMAAVKFAKEAGAGHLCLWTDADGIRHRGVLMPMSWEPTDVEKRVRPKIVRAEWVRELWNTHRSYFPLTGAAGFNGPCVLKTGGYGGVSVGLCLSVPGSKLHGGKYFLDPELRQIVGEFEGNRTSMVARNLSVDQVVQAVELLQRKGFFFELDPVLLPWVNERLSQEAEPAEADKPDVVKRRARKFGLTL